MVLWWVLVVAAKSISSSAQYVILAQLNWVKKSQNLWVWLRKLVLAAQHGLLQWLVKGTSSSACTYRKDLTNPSVFLIGPS
jgi:hypothetical protein